MDSQIDTRGSDQYGDDGEPAADDLQHPQIPLDLADVLGLEDHELRVNGRDPSGRLESGADQLVLDLGHDRSHVDGDLTVLDGHRTIRLAREGLVHGVVGPAVRVHPDLVEGIAGDHPLHGAADQALQSALDRAVQVVDQLGRLRRDTFLLRRLLQLLDQSVHIDLCQDRVGHALGDRLLHVRVARQRSHGGDVAVGVPHDAVRPDRDDGEQGQQRGEEDQQERSRRPEPVVPRGPGGPAALKCAHAMPKLVQLVAFARRELLVAGRACGVRVRWGRAISHGTRRTIRIGSGDRELPCG